MNAGRVTLGTFWRRGSLDATSAKVFGYLVGLILSVGIALAVVFAVLEAQSRRVLDNDSLAWPISLLVGPAAFGNSAEQAWTAVRAGNWSEELREFYQHLLLIHVIADVVFIAVYLVLVILLARAIFATKRIVIVFVLVGLLGLTDVVENGALLLAAHSVTVDAPLLAWVTNAKVLVWVPRVKWILAAAVVLVLVVGVLTQRRDKRPRPLIRPHSLAIAWSALLVQRLSLLPALAFFVLSVTAGTAILEQLPDVQRGWIDDGLWETNALWAVQGVLLVTASVVVTTRLRLAASRTRAAEQSARAASPEPKPALGPVAKARLRMWWIGPAVVLTLGVIAFFSGRAGVTFWNAEPRVGQPDIHGVRLLIFLLVPAGIVGLSRFIRWRWSRRKDPPPPYRYPLVTPGLVPAVAFVGNVAAISLLVVSGLGMIRAFVPLVILGVQREPGSELLQLNPDLVNRAWVWVAAGIATVVGPWLVMIGLTRLAARRPALPRWEQRNSRQLAWIALNRWRSRPAGWFLMTGWVAVFLTLAMSPTWASDIGLAATAILGIGALTGMISAMGLLMQDQAPAEVFRVLHLQRTPYITVLVLTLVLVGLTSGAGTIHEVDRGRPGTPEGRALLDTAFQEWVATDNRCRMVAGGRRVRPLLLIAAEGGGIRAAYWTVRGLEALGAGTCAGRSVLLSSGASGGSVGLTVARFSGTRQDPGIRRAVETIDQMAEEEILAAGADGMFTRDVFYGATGVPLPRLDTATDSWAWHDRARLIEQGWQGAYDRAGEAWGSRSFLDETDLSPVTGHLVLNSTSVKSNCRVWISQLKLPVNGTAARNNTLDPEHNCDKVSGPGPRTIDLFSTYGPYTNEAQEDDGSACLGDITAATAALLTARFPYVTPGGVVGPCPNRGSTAQPIQPYWPATQLVDGGYIENTGLATLTDLAPEWLRIVREHNAEAVDPANKQDLVVPFIIYLTNGDLDTIRPKLGQGPTSEVSLPILTFQKGGTSLAGSGALLERARESVQTEQFCPEPTVCDKLAIDLPRRVIVVDRLPQPEIAAPLGWALSQSTRDTLNAAIDYQFKADCEGTEVARPPTCRLGYAPLGELRRYLLTR